MSIQEYILPAAPITVQPGTPAQNNHGQDIDVDVDFLDDLRDLDGVFIKQVRTMRGEQVGEVRKTWAGIMQESFTTADNFGVTFPVNMDIRMKALLIGATFLIDFIEFEAQR